MKAQGWGRVLQPSPHRPWGSSTSQRSMGREIRWEFEGPWRGGSLYRTCVKCQQVGECDTSHPRHQIHAVGCLLRATLVPWQTGMHGHSWASLVPPSPQDDAVTLLSPLLVPRCQVRSRAQTQLIRGWPHSCPCPRGWPWPQGAVRHARGCSKGPSEVPRSGPARHRVGDLLRALMHSQQYPALP